MKKNGMSWVELLAVLVIVMVLGAIILSIFAQPSSGKRATCGNYLKVLGLTMKMYANEQNGLFPSLGYYHELLVDCDSLEFESVDRVASVFTNSLHIPSIYPEYLPDANVLVCPKDVENQIRDGGWTPEVIAGEFNQVCAQGGRGVRIAGDSYTYLAHYFDRVGEENPTVNLSRVAGFEDSEWKDSEVPLQLGLYANLIASLRDSDPEELIRLMDGDLWLEESFIPIEGLEQSNEDRSTYRLFRLREGISRYFITDINAAETFTHSKSGIPVMFDNPGLNPVEFNHIPGGSNVLYLDGHVSFVRYGEGFVTSNSFARVMDGLY